MTKRFKVSTQDLGGSKLKIQVEAGAEVVSQASKSVSRQVLKHVSVPGFRRDKTPLALVKRHIGPERFDEYVQEELLPQAYYDALLQEGIRPISEVTYGSKALEGSVFRFEASFAVAPEFKLGDYKSIKVEPETPAEVTAEQIDKTLQAWLRKQAQTKDFPEGTITEAGHFVTVLVRGKIDGADSRFLKHYNVGLVLGEDSLYPDLDKHLIGHKKLDRVEFDYVFASDYANKALAGKTASLEVKILSHKEMIVPVLDEAFLKEKTDHKSLEDLKAALQVEHVRRSQEEAKEKFRRKIQDALYAIIACEVPKGLIEELTGAKLEDLKGDLSGKGMSMDDYYSSQGKTAEEFKAELDVASERELKLSFALTEIARLENLPVEDNEIIRRIQYTSMMIRKPFSEVLQYVESLGRRILIKSEIMQEKALYFVEEQLSGSAKA